MVKKVKEEKILLEEEEVWDILEFAKALGYNNSYLTPMLINSRMKDITLNSSAATESDLAEAMEDPKNSEISLQEFSQDFEIKSQVYKRLLSYLGNLLSFDMTYECTNAKMEDYKTKSYQKDLDLFKKFVDGFDYKKEFAAVVGELLRSEAGFYCPRQFGEKISLQELPTSPTYTMISGRWANGLLFDFNMYWFLQPGVVLGDYPDFFVDKYKNFFQESKGANGYVPSLSANQRGRSSWVYWQSIPPDVGWCWKLNPNSATRVPYFSGLFLDLVQQPVIRALQKNVNMGVANRMIIGQVGMLKEANSKVKDQFSLNPDLLGKFLSLVKAAVGESIKVAAAPLENLQKIEFKSESEIYSDYLKTALATSGVNTNLLFTSDVKQNTIETQLSVNVDEQMMYALYPQFESFMNYHINKLTKNFKFNVHFEGSQFYNNRSQRFDAQMTLLGNGIVMPNKIAASIGMNPFEFQRNLEESKAIGWADKLISIMPDAKLKNKEDVGRPKLSDGELSESGEQTRADGGNVPKVKQ